MASELGTTVGEGVGFKIRFTDQVSEKSYVKLMTDGILLAEVQRDPFLAAYDTIIIDEAHERSLNIDFLLGYLKRLLPRRPDLKLVITSATIDPERFSDHFDGAPILFAEGRTYPVELRYAPPGGEDEEGDGLDEPDLPTAIVEACGTLLAERQHDILVFLSGEREIREAADLLGKQTSRDKAFRGVEILPLFSRLSNAEQNRIFQPHGRPRIVLATNVAETSLTVPGIRAVVDTGLARMSRYSVRSKVQRLPIERVSQASANQRKGRCGREAPGTCIRLYAEEDFEARPEFTEPEILRTNLAAVILQMSAMRLGRIDDFPFVESPEPKFVNDGYPHASGARRARREARADPARPPAREAARRPAPRPHAARRRRRGLRERGADDRQRPLRPGPSRAPVREARGGRSAARRVQRRELRLPLLAEPLELRHRPEGEPLELAVPKDVPSALSLRAPGARVDGRAPTARSAWRRSSSCPSRRARRSRTTCTARS